MIRHWSLDKQSRLQSRSQGSSTEYISNRIELLDKHIEATLTKLEQAYSMVLDLEVLLVPLSSFINKKKTEGI